MSSGSRRLWTTLTKDTLPLTASMVGYFVFIVATLIWHYEKKHLVARVWFGLSGALFLTPQQHGVGPGFVLAAVSGRSRVRAVLHLP
jgi:hypothetical protein